MSKTEIRSPHNSPSNSSDGDPKVQELIFEISDTGENKLIFAIAGVSRQQKVNRELLAVANEAGINFRVISSGHLMPAKVLPTLIDLVGRGGAVSITEIAHLEDKRRTALFEALNFHRDAILKLPLTLILWVNTDVTYELAAKAPDLWSRRTTVLSFESVSARALIRRLFHDSPIPRESWTGKDPLSECLEYVLSKENQLRQCQTITSEVGIPRAKEAQISLLEASDKLLAAATSNRKIELSLWLWNLARVDSVIQDWLNKLGENDRRAFEHMYLDRNEVLLKLAEKMPRIIRQYKQLIEKTIGRRKPVSLLDLYMANADKELGAISDQLIELNYQIPVEMQFNPEDVSDHSVFTEMATAELQSWLLGETRKRPRYLNRLEGDLLKALYSGKPVLAQAGQFGATDDQVLRFIGEVEKKVRMVLGRRVARV
jgi:hypothetical protein